ncbi:MAG: hypothetical protein QM831_45365 [Kofleriaceae bacterium]
MAAGCSFSPGANQQAGDDASSGTHDAASIDAPPGKVYMDAPAKVWMDAPCSDVDADGICDDVDDWNCGPTKPTTPGQAFALGGNPHFSLTNIKVNGGNAVANVPKNTKFRMQFDWAATDTTCPGNCIDQLEVGWHKQNAAAAGHKIGCYVDEPIDKNNGTNDNVDDNGFSTFNGTGVYELRIRIDQQFKCSDVADWPNNGEPTDYFALFCLY